MRFSNVFENLQVHIRTFRSSCTIFVPICTSVLYGICLGSRDLEIGGQLFIRITITQKQ